MWSLGNLKLIAKINTMSLYNLNYIGCIIAGL